MQEDFHYYAAYCGAYLAGYSHEESLQICYANQFTDVCSDTFLQKVKGPKQAVTTQLPEEMANQRVDLVGLQEITRIWASFHFLPKNLHAEVPKGSRYYQNKYRLLCGDNGEPVQKTVELAKGKGVEAAGLAMHVLSDTWAHANFAGTPSLAMNNIDTFFQEVSASGEITGSIHFHNLPNTPDNPEQGTYLNSLYKPEENDIMNLGHGRAGHLPDYSFMRYSYMPAWKDYELLVKDNPRDYYLAFCQMVQALCYLRGESDSFALHTYAFDKVHPYETAIRAILEKRQLNSSADWKAFGESLSGNTIPDFDMHFYEAEYLHAANRENTPAGRFFQAAIAQKTMVTREIYLSGNLLAGFTVGEGIPSFRELQKQLKLQRSKKGAENQ